MIINKLVLSKNESWKPRAQCSFRLKNYQHFKTSELSENVSPFLVRFNIKTRNLKTWKAVYIWRKPFAKDNSDESIYVASVISPIFSTSTHYHCVSTCNWNWDYTDKSELVQRNFLYLNLFADAFSYACCENSILKI